MTTRGRFAGLVDTALEASVIGGFSRVGPLVRGRIEQWADPPSLDGRVCLVTGASGGLGLAASTGLARLGASLRLLVRDAGRGEEARRRGSSRDRQRGRALRARRHLAAPLGAGLRRAPRWRPASPCTCSCTTRASCPRERQETAEGLELTFATNVLGPHLLTRLLRERLIASAPARVVFVSSGGMYTRPPGHRRPAVAQGTFDGRVAYARSKRAEVVLAERWAEELAGTGVVVHAMHPGWADTPGIQTSIPTFRRVMRPLLRSPEQGADTIVWLAAAPEPAAVTGRFWSDRHERPRIVPSRARARRPRSGNGSGMRSTRSRPVPPRRYDHARQPLTRSQGVAGITLDGVSKVFAGGVQAVDNVSLEIGDGEFMVLVGPSGCGKTTILRMVAGLEEVTDGEIAIGDRVVTDLAPKDRDIAMVFQNYALYPHMTVEQNLGFGLKLRKTPKVEIKRRVDDAAQILGLDPLLKRKPAALSGGQRQRVAMGRAMVREPRAFLMDEPLSNLDAKLRVQMRAELARLRDRLKTTTSTSRTTRSRR